MEFSRSPGSALGGASSATSADSMRAARLARFQTGLPSEAGPDTSLHSVNPDFATLPEGALLRVTASLDLQSGVALSSAASSSRESTAGVVQALGTSASQVQHEHTTAMAAIQEERNEHHQTVDRAILLGISGMLAQLRNSQVAQQRHGEALAELFGALDEALGSTDDPPGVDSSEFVEEAAATVEHVSQPVSVTSLCNGGAPAASLPNFGLVPEGPLFHLAALMDLDSGAAFNAADSAMQESTEAALRSLAAAIAQINRDHESTTAAIEQERLQARQRQTAEGAAWATALELLAPHRASFDRLQGMNGQVAELFGLLQQGPERQQDPEMEAAFEARIAEAGVVARAREAAMRSRIADGELLAVVAM